MLGVEGFWLKVYLAAQELPAGSCTVEYPSFPFPVHDHTTLCTAGPTKLFLLLQGSALEEPPLGFLPKRGFQLNIRSGMHVRLVLRAFLEVPPVRLLHARHRLP